jgi:DTW domain-containing protein YfiP
LPHLDCLTPVSLIVHRNELLRSSGTASTAQLCLTKSQILPYGIQDAPFDSADLMSVPGQALYLFPETDADLLDANWVRANPGPWHLIVPDGSWGQAVRMRRRIPALALAKAVCLANPEPSRYELRTARSPDRLCTLEAVAYALGELEGPHIREALLAALAIQVERMKGNRVRFRTTNKTLEESSIG